MALVAAPGGAGQKALPCLALDQGAGLGDALHADDVHVGLGAELLELLAHLQPGMSSGQAVCNGIVCE